MRIETRPARRCSRNVRRHCTELGTTSRTKILARAFKFYGTEDDDASVHLATPRVEALAREIVRGHGVPMLLIRN